MAVPNTTTFTLQDVINEVNPATNDLIGCFVAANPDYFNPNYEGSKNSLLNFRDYGSHNYTSPTETIEVSPSSFNLPFTKNTVRSTITTLPSAGSWYIQSSPSWVNASKSGDTTLTMAIEINDSGYNRLGIVVLVHSISSSVTTNVLINQQGTG